jgi:hypothetical protein
MKRLFALLGSLLLLLVVAAPAVMAADGDLVQTDRTIVVFNGDVELPAGEQADVVFVGRGNAFIEGMANSVTIVDGSATLRGATVETLTIINGTAHLETGTSVTGDVVQLNATITQAEGVTIGGRVTSLGETLTGLVLFLGFAAILVWLGIALATLVAGLALAAFGARQVRQAEAIISNEPLKTFVAGLLMVVIPPLIFLALAVTVIGLPLALGSMLFVWPTLAFVGYLVAAIWIGEWLLRGMGRQQAERPYLATFLGLIVTTILGIVPLVTAVISIFGLGGVALAGWRTLVGRRPQSPSFQPYPAPVQG